MGLKIETFDWKEFLLADLFYISGSKTTKIDDLYEHSPGKYPYVTTKSTNNGIDGYYDFYTEKGGCITVDSAVVGISFYQEQNFSASDHVEILRPKTELTRNCMLFISTLLNQECFKYSYGRKRSQKKLKKEFIKLPIKIDNTPNWQYMDEFIEDIINKKRSNGQTLAEYIKTANKHQEQPLNTDTWKMFKLSDLFDIKYGINMELNALEQVDSKSDNAVAFVGRSSEDNGVTAYVQRVLLKEPQSAGLISMATGGSVLSTYLQPQQFYSGRDTYILSPKKYLSTEVKLFICTVIKKEKYRYSYGRQVNKQLPFFAIKLPQTPEGNPDYEYMENYIKTLPYANKI